MPQLCQQFNFRLLQPVNSSELKFWLINDQQQDTETEEFKLYQIMTNYSKRR